MMDDCYCGYDYDFTWALYRPSRVVARKAHFCYECGASIRPGERYEYVFAIGQGEVYTYHTCARCLALREDLESAPCFCWSHGHMLEDIANVVDDMDRSPERWIFRLRLARIKHVAMKDRSERKAQKLAECR